jgi:hypothetical protein
VLRKSAGIRRQEQCRDSSIGTISAGQAMDALANASFASPLANANLKIATAGSGAGLLTGLYNGFNVWTALLTVFLTLVAYDQCELRSATSQSVMVY